MQGTASSRPWQHAACHRLWPVCMHGTDQDCSKKALRPRHTCERPSPLHCTLYALSAGCVPGPGGLLRQAEAFDSRFIRRSGLLSRAPSVPSVLNVSEFAVLDRNPRSVAMRAIGSFAMSALQRPTVACSRTAHRPPSHRRAAPNCPPNSALKHGASHDLHTAVRRATAHTTARGSWRRAPLAFKQSERFTANAKLAVKKAQAEGCKLGKNYAGPEHLLLGVLAADDGLPPLDQGAAQSV